VISLNENSLASGSPSSISKYSSKTIIDSRLLLSNNSASSSPSNFQLQSHTSMPLYETLHQSNSSRMQQPQTGMKLEQCEIMDEVVDYDLDEENLKLNIMDLYPKDSNNNQNVNKSSPSANKKSRSSNKTSSSAHKKSHKKSKKSKLERVSSLSSISSFLDTSISSMSMSSNSSSCSCSSENIYETSSSSIDLLKKTKTSRRSRTVAHKKSSKSTHARKSSTRKDLNNNELDEEVESGSSRKRKSSKRKEAKSKRVKTEKNAAQTAGSSSLMNEIKKNKNGENNQNNVNQKPASMKEKRLSEKIELEEAETKLEDKKEESCEAPVVAAPSAPAILAPQPAKEKIIILIDFELVLDCEQCSKKQALKELNELSEVLPVLAYKLANFNYASYYNQFSNKLRLVKCYRESIKSLKSMNEMDLIENAANESAIDEKKTEHDEEDFDLAQDLKSKLDLIDKVLNECMFRLEIQHDYLNRVIELFEQFAKCRTSLELNACVEDKREYLLSMQAKLMDYAYSILLSSKVESLDEIYFIKTLPFNALIDVLDRFVLVYNL
jgi:hypothetical protein